MKKLEEQEEGKLSLYRSDISWNNLSKFLFQIFNDVILQKEDVRVSFSDKNMLSDIYEIDTKARLRNRTRVCLFSSFSRRIGRSFTHRLCKNRVMSVRVFFFFLINIQKVDAFTLCVNLCDLECSGSEKTGTLTCTCKSR